MMRDYFVDAVIYQGDLLVERVFIVKLVNRVLING
jgi:hypothetical protein